MKKSISLILAIVCMVLSCFSANAASHDTSTAIIIVNRNRSSITGQKSVYQKDSDGNNVAMATLTGTFTFNGTSSSCTGASCDVTIYNDAWSTKSVNAYTSGSSTVAEVTLVRKFLFITVETKNFTITLSCDRNGNLS